MMTKSRKISVCSCYFVHHPTLNCSCLSMYSYQLPLSYLDSSGKLTPFECGFDPLSKMRSPFSTRLFLLVVLFLIFDVEIALLFPVLSIFSTNTTLLMTTTLTLFLLILLFGMFHEWNEGALDWFSS
uniref:NADH-ubiquinone oxidoreductase chain 3 n=1 Tax=Tyrannodoris europaea TaxID=189538 RepID=Q8HKA8_TYREU|nr:NADH dehydrogenase subunit 3 [Tyrannodoris europaea]AAL91057.1 NADH dehydrogenase subunit 3 [Tyrannodoris europaea]